MKKILSLLIILLFVTVCFKDGSIVKYDWADGYVVEENWNKVSYKLYKRKGIHYGRTLLIPAENILWIEKIGRHK